MDIFQQRWCSLTFVSVRGVWGMLSGQLQPAAAPGRLGQVQDWQQPGEMHPALPGDRIPLRGPAVRPGEWLLSSGHWSEAESLLQECFCGNTLPADKKKNIPSESCNMECPGDSAQSCGGYLTMDIFGTGITFPTLWRIRCSELRIFSGLVPLIPSKIGLSGGDIDKPVKIVYLLTIAGRASRQVRRLVKQIYSPEHYIFVHVDSRWSSL